MSTSTQSETQKASTSKPANAMMKPQTSSSTPLNPTDFERLTSDLGGAIQDYGRKQPQAIAIGIFVLGFMIGWKIKPW